MSADIYPDVSKMDPERRELFRLAGVNALKRCGGRDLDLEALRWAERMAKLKPLGRALIEGSWLCALTTRTRVLPLAGDVSEKVL
jgi:hypothetical protein